MEHRNRTVGTTPVPVPGKSVLVCLEPEKLEDLDKDAIVVARLGRKSSDFALNPFDVVYADLKLGKTELRKFDVVVWYDALFSPEKKMNSAVPFKNMKFPVIEWRITQPLKLPVQEHEVSGSVPVPRAVPWHRTDRFRSRKIPKNP